MEFRLVLFRYQSKTRRRCSPRLSRPRHSSQQQRRSSKPASGCPLAHPHSQQRAAPDPVAPLLLLRSRSCTPEHSQTAKQTPRTHCPRSCPRRSLQTARLEPLQSSQTLQDQPPQQSTTRPRCSPRSSPRQQSSQQQRRSSKPASGCRLAPRHSQQQAAPGPVAPLPLLRSRSCTQ